VYSNLKKKLKGDLAEGGKGQTGLGGVATDKIFLSWKLRGPHQGRGGIQKRRRTKEKGTCLEVIPTTWGGRYFVRKRGYFGVVFFKRRVKKHWEKERVSLFFRGAKRKMIELTAGGEGKRLRTLSLCQLKEKSVGGGGVKKVRRPSQYSL